jgi:hypothetical protein
MVYLVLLTVWVWIMVFQAISKAREGVWFSYDDFRLLLLGYHMLLLLITMIGWIMQSTWRYYTYLALFPASLLIGTIALSASALQIFFVVTGFGN